MINGICIKNNKLSEEILEEISKLFPNATIFNADLDVVYYPHCETLKNNKKVYNYYMFRDYSIDNSFSLQTNN